MQTQAPSCGACGPGYSRSTRCSLPRIPVWRRPNDPAMQSTRPINVDVVVAVTMSLDISCTSQRAAGIVDIGRGSSPVADSASSLWLPSAPWVVDVPWVVVGAPPFSAVLVPASCRVRLPHLSVGHWLLDPAKQRRPVALLWPMVRVRPIRGLPARVKFAPVDRRGLRGRRLRCALADGARPRFGADRTGLDWSPCGSPAPPRVLERLGGVVTFGDRSGHLNKLSWFGSVFSASSDTVVGSTALTSARSPAKSLGRPAHAAMKSETGHRSSCGRRA